MPIARRVADILAAALVSLFLVATVLPSSMPASASTQWLQNGGFESGSSGWQVAGAAAAGCEPRSGSGVLAVAVGEQGVQLYQDIPGLLPGGTYRLTVHARAAGPAASLRSTVRWGNPPLTATASITAGAAYSELSRETLVQTLEPGARITLTVTSASPTVICIDDVNFEGPFNPTGPLTPVAEAPSPTPTSTPFAAAPGVPSATPPPADNGQQITATATRTATMTPTATPAAGFVFINGGFEDGTAGWDTYGGEAGTVASPTRSGGAAGLFESSTTSTKWLFQPVRIEGDLAYTFSGYLMPDEGVSEAYLRLSWYASSDASGAAIRSDDSTARAGPGSAFVFLTTGAVVPPADASSARVRVMLAPAGSAPASLYLDDFSFVAGPPPEATATAVAAAPGANAPADEPQSGATPSAVATSDNSTARSAAAPASRTPSPRAASATPKARATAAIEAGLTIPPSSPGSLPPWPLIAGPAAAMALAGGYLLGRRRSE